jgi:hypothetical protein
MKVKISFNPKSSFDLKLVIPAQAGIQLIEKFPRSGTSLWICPLRGMFVRAGFPPARE